MVVEFSETWLNWPDGITTTDAKLVVIIGADDSRTKDDVSLGEEDVIITTDDGFRAGDDNDIMTDDVMILDTFTPDDWSAKIKIKGKGIEKKITFILQYVSSAFCYLFSSIIRSRARYKLRL